MSSRAELVEHARGTIAAGSKSFAAASKLFDPVTRERAWLLYAWCRHCDDVADGQAMGGELGDVPDPVERISILRGRTATALSGQATGEPAFDCLGVVAAECRLPPAHVEDVLAGFALDAADWRPRSEADLHQYCYHVAGAVGVLMAVVMGVDPDDGDTLDRACDLGLAFQLANIARDVAEDARGGRCYLPLDWLVAEDMEPGQHMAPWQRAGLVRVVARMCDRAERYEASARVGAARLPTRSRWAVLAAAGIYGDIARGVRARGAHAWDHREVTTRASKARWIARAAVQARRAPVPVGREGLWTRPQ